MDPSISFQKSGTTHACFFFSSPHCAGSTICTKQTRLIDLTWFAGFSREEKNVSPLSSHSSHHPTVQATTSSVGAAAASDRGYSYDSGWWRASSRSLLLLASHQYCPLLLAFASGRSFQTSSPSPLAYATDRMLLYYKPTAYDRDLVGDERDLA